MSYWAIWLVVIILLSVIEICTVNLVAVWFIASGILTLITSLFTDSFFIQFAVFVLFGIVFLIATRPLLKKMKQKEEEKTNLERIIGMTGVVTKAIAKNQIGEVKVDGKLWSAISENKIALNKIVKVKAIDSVKLVVEKEKEVKESTTPKKKSTNANAKKKKTSSTSTKKKQPNSKKGKKN